MAQSLRYINPKNAAVVFCDDPPFLFNKITGIGQMDAQLMTSEPAGLDGSAFNGLYISPREVTVTMHIEGNKRKGMYEEKMKLSAVMSPELHKNGALGRLEYTNDYGSWWIPAAVKRGPQGASRAGNFLINEQLVFYCPSPYWRGFSYNRVRMAYLGGGLRFPVRFGTVKFGAHAYKASLFNLGNQPSPLEISITGPAVAPRITKASTGEYILLREDKALIEGDILYINTTPGDVAVTIKHANGQSEEAIGYINLSSKLFLLDPGENVLQYGSADDTQTSVINMATQPWFGGV